MLSVRSTALVALVVFASAASAQKQVIIPPGQNASPMLSPGIRAGDLLFVSGQLPDRGDSTIQQQTTKTLEKMKKVLDAAGTSVDNVVKCTVFLIDVKDFGGMNEAYRAFFTKDPPARSTVVVAALVSAGPKLEIECIASMK